MGASIVHSPCFQRGSARMAFSPTSIAEAIERFMRTEVQVADNDPMFTRDAHLFECGFVDSVGFVRLVTFAESTFDVQVDADVLMSEDFTPIDGVSNVVACSSAQHV